MVLVLGLGVGRDNICPPVRRNRHMMVVHGGGGVPTDMGRSRGRCNVAPLINNPRVVSPHVCCESADVVVGEEYVGGERGRH